MRHATRAAVPDGTGGRGTAARPRPRGRFPACVLAASALVALSAPDSSCWPFRRDPPDLSGRYLIDMRAVVRQRSYGVPFLPDAAPLSEAEVAHLGDRGLLFRYQVPGKDGLAEKVARCDTEDGAFRWEGDRLVRRETRRHKDFAVVWGRTRTETAIRKNAGGDLVFETTVRSVSFEVPIFPVVRRGSYTTTVVLPRLPPGSGPVFRARPVMRGTVLDRRDIGSQDDVAMLDCDVRLQPPCSVAAWVRLRDPGTPGSLLFGYGATILSRGRLARDRCDYLIGVEDGRLSCHRAWSFGRAVAAAREPFPLDRWTFVAVTHEGRTVKLYQDGRLAGIHEKMDAYEPLACAPVAVGGIFDPNIPGGPLEIQVFSSLWRGSVAGLTVYDRVLALGEVEAMHAKGAAGLQREEPAASAEGGRRMTGASGAGGGVPGPRNAREPR